MEIVPVAGAWRITGKGWGHGVGMCQFGANGMARRGTGFREILARYYPGTEIIGESP
jgi:stage II sporulation protein D